MATLKALYQAVTCGCVLIVTANASSAQKLFPEAVTDLTDQIAKRATKEQRTKIAVLPFRELGGQPTVFGTYIAEELVTGLTNAGGFDLVERTTLDKVMGELRLNESGSIDPDTAKSVGKLVGADAIVTGTVTDLESYVAINCRLINSQTGRIFAAAATKVVKDDDVKKIMRMPIEMGQSGGSSVKPVGREPTGGSVLEFRTEAYVLVSNLLHKVGSNLTLTTTLEAMAEQPMEFYIGNCSLLDENGERWEAEGRDSGHFVQIVTLMPATKIKSKFQFAAKGDNNGTRFTLTCSEYKPKSGRYITIHAIPTQ